MPQGEFRHLPPPRALSRAANRGYRRMPAWVRSTFSIYAFSRPPPNCVTSCAVRKFLEISFRIGTGDRRGMRCHQSARYTTVHSDKQHVMPDSERDKKWRPPSTPTTRVPSRSLAVFGHLTPSGQSVGPNFPSFRAVCRPSHPCPVSVPCEPQSNILGGFNKRIVHDDNGSISPS